MIKYSYLLVISIFLFSCANNEEISTYTVKPGSFSNVITIEGFVEPINTTTLTCPRGVDGIVSFLVEDGTYVEEGDIVCIIEDQEKQTDYDELLVNYENMQANFAKTQADFYLQYTLLQAQVKNNDADNEIALLDSLQLTYSTPKQKRIKTLELEKVALEKVKLNKKLESLKIIQQSDIRKMEIELERTSNRIKSMKEQIDALTIKAPRKGLATRPIFRVTRAKLQVGDNVWNNMPVVVMPELDKMKIKISAPERDFKSISVGDSVMYTFDAMPGNTAGGKITKKTPIGQQYKQGSKVKYFDIEASIDTMTQLPEPGYTANCNIIIKQIKDTIVIPQIAVFDQDSIKVVYVKNKNKFEMRQVLMGLSSSKETIIAHGLKKNEIIALTKPKESLIESQMLLPDSITKKSN